MADNSTGEKTEEATPHKLLSAQKKGQVAKSADFASSLSLAGAFFALLLFISYIASELSSFISKSISAQNSDDLSRTIFSLLDEAAFLWLLLSLPVIFAALIFGLLGNYLQIGFIFSLDPIQVKWDKINPVNGLKQIFSKKKLVQLLQQLLKFILVILVIKSAAEESLVDIILSQEVKLSVAMMAGLSIIKTIMIRILVLFLLMGAADFFWQRRVFLKSMMMSKYEVKQEYKQSEGDPQLKHERKRLAREMIQGGQQKVAKADAVITNPLFIAAAIKYDASSQDAPVLVAKGLWKNAETIRDIANKNDIPILRNVPLAQALIKLEIDDQIPEDLYEAVAEVLNFVYELKK